MGHVSQPSLVNLLPDPALTETVAYPLPEGDATLGTSETAAVRLHGLLIDKLHWWVPPERDGAGCVRRRHRRDTDTCVFERGPLNCGTFHEFIWWPLSLMGWWFGKIILRN